MDYRRYTVEVRVAGAIGASAEVRAAGGVGVGLVVFSFVRRGVKGDCDWGLRLVCAVVPLVLLWLETPEGRPGGVSGSTF